MRKGDKRKAEIIGAAYELFSQKGYRKTTLSEIISHLGCSKGSFYHHFASKLSVLQALANQRVENDYRAYAAVKPKDGLERLNRLLYYSAPYRAGEEDFLAAILGLGLQQEGATITAHLRQARKQAFYADLLAILSGLRDQGLAHFGSASLPELLWDTHMAFCDTMLAESCRIIASGATPAGRWVDMLRAARFQWERLLDLPFGSVTIIEADEMLSLLRLACDKVRLEEEQLRFDGGFALPCQGIAKTI
ncbi:MAG: TetR/AcrR family transcriptional regulator [Christensenellales bacterium]